MKGLDGKTAIVSGGATLIGVSCASVLAGYGVNVVIADINEADGKQAAESIGARATFIRADITSDDDIAALVAATVKRYGRLDFLVNVVTITGVVKPSGQSRYRSWSSRYASSTLPRRCSSAAYPAAARSPCTG